MLSKYKLTNSFLIARVFLFFRNEVTWWSLTVVMFFHRRCLSVPPVTVLVGILFFILFLTKQFKDIYERNQKFYRMQGYNEFVSKSKRVLFPLYWEVCFYVWHAPFVSHYYKFKNTQYIWYVFLSEMIFVTELKYSLFLTHMIACYLCKLLK